MSYEDELHEARLKEARLIVDQAEDLQRSGAEDAKESFRRVCYELATFRIPVLKDEYGKVIKKGGK